MSKSWMIAFNYMKKLNGEDPGQAPDPEPEPTPDPTPGPNPNPDPNPSEKCPNKPECNVEICLDCGVEYCSTHGLHVCTINGKKYSRPYLYVSVEDTDTGWDIQHQKLKRYNFTDKCWEDFKTDPEFGLVLYNSKTKLKTGMYTYKKLNEDMITKVQEVLKEDLGEYVCSDNEAPPKP
jgi:hypothetical protein